MRPPAGAFAVYKKTLLSLHRPLRRPLEPRANPPLAPLPSPHPKRTSPRGASRVAAPALTHPPPPRPARRGLTLTPPASPPASLVVLTAPPARRSSARPRRSPRPWASPRPRASARASRSPRRARGRRSGTPWSTECSARPSTRSSREAYPEKTRRRRRRSRSPPPRRGRRTISREAHHPPLVLVRHLLPRGVPRVVPRPRRGAVHVARVVRPARRRVALCERDPLRLPDRNRPRRARDERKADESRPRALRVSARPPAAVRVRRGHRKPAARASVLPRRRRRDRTRAEAGVERERERERFLESERKNAATTATAATPSAPSTHSLPECLTSRASALLLTRHPETALSACPTPSLRTSSRSLGRPASHPPEPRVPGRTTLASGPSPWRSSSAPRRSLRPRGSTSRRTRRGRGRSSTRPSCRCASSRMPAESKTSPTRSSSRRGPGARWTRWKRCARGGHCAMEERRRSRRPRVRRRRTRREVPRRPWTRGVPRRGVLRSSAAARSPGSRRFSVSLASDARWRGGSNDVPGHRATTRERSRRRESRCASPREPRRSAAPRGLPGRAAPPPSRRARF